MSKLMELNEGVSLRCREELKRLGIKGVDFVKKTGLLKQTFSAVLNGVNSAPTGFISALCTNYPADVVYIITGVRSSTSDNTATASVNDLNDLVDGCSFFRRVNYDPSRDIFDQYEKEIRRLWEELIKSREREIADKERIINLLTEWKK